MVSSLIIMLALAQRAFSQYSNPFNETGFGQYQLSNTTNPAILGVLNRPNSGNSLPFQGFNVTKNLTSSFSGSLSSEHEWALSIEFSATNVSGTGNEQNTVEIYSYSMWFNGENFVDGRYPLNTSDWSICATVFNPPFANSIENAKGNSSDSSCAPYIGQACADAFVQALNEAPSLNGGCRQVPAFSQIDGCKDVFAEDGGSTGTAVVTNTTIEGLIFYPNNNSWVNPETGVVYDNISMLPNVGLASGETFAYIQKVIPSTSASMERDSLQLNMLALNLIPNDNNVDVMGTGYSPQSRLLCGRASTSASSWGDTSGSFRGGIPTLTLACLVGFSMSFLAS